ncbi:MAG: GDP-mannose 4,6-dehydratase [Micavibrio sp.]|nr:MAG: GDP-mannose 4,6-dehydratase [Micavibrio sp.]
MTQRKRALITGITGQDGSLLAEFLLEKSYEVHGLVRWDSVDTTQRIKKRSGSYQNLYLHFADMNDAQTITRLIKETRPDEIYNLAALTHVQVSFETPAAALETNALGTQYVLEAVRLLDMENDVRIYQASSSEMFGSIPAPQNEASPFAPCSPYAIAKLTAYWMARMYRDAYGLHVSNGILFNHESPVRGEDFVTRKITKAVAAIEAGQQDVLALGNLESVRDWGHARDYIEGIWLMLQQDAPDDYVLATGKAHSVREFTERAFAHIGVKLVWEGEGINEIGKDAKTGKVLVKVDPALFRPKDVNYLLGDAAKAQEKLGWSPRISFDDLVSEMVNADREALRSGEEPWQMAG